MFLLIQRSNSYVGGVFETVTFPNTLPEALNTLFVVDLHIVCLQYPRFLGSAIT